MMTPAFGAVLLISAVVPSLAGRSAWVGEFGVGSGASVDGGCWYGAGFEKHDNSCTGTGVTRCPCGVVYT
jgi:hypothetical protein